MDKHGWNKFNIKYMELVEANMDYMKVIEAKMEAETRLKREEVNDAQK